MSINAFNTDLRARCATLGASSATLGGRGGKVDEKKTAMITEVGALVAIVKELLETANLG